MREAELMAFAVGALDPGRRRDVAAQIVEDGQLQLRLAQIRQRLGAVPSPRISPWQLPPPGMSGPLGGRLTARPAQFMGTLRPGRRFVTHLDSVPEPERRRLVVLYRRREQWEVVYPTVPEDGLRLVDLPVDKGGRRLELTAMEEPGLQRWAIALPAIDAPLNLSAPPQSRWQALMAAIYAGEVPVSTTEIKVAPRV